MEVWKDVPGYEGRYQVSDKGRVKHLSHDIWSVRHNGFKTLKERIMRLTDNGHGYKFVSLRDGKRKKNFYVHRLVAMAFIPNPDNLPAVNHVDYNRANNAVGNLEWCTAKENIVYSSQNMRKPKAKSKATNTGEKYVRFCKANCKHKAHYRVCIRQIGVDKWFANLDAAIQYRNEVVQEWQNQ